MHPLVILGWHFRPFSIISNFLLDVESKIVDNKDGTAKVSFKPPQSGLYRIEVHIISTKSDKKIKVKNSPFKVNIDFEEAPAPKPGTLIYNSYRYIHTYFKRQKM